MEEQKPSEVMHDLDNTMEQKPLFTLPVILVLFLAAVLGVGTGYAFAVSGGKVATVSVSETPTDKDKVTVGDTYGSTDAKTFKDDAEGVLKEGGKNGEGEYHLERPGGESQNVYLTSSTLDMSLFLNRKIKIWGQTYDAQAAGWLMDVGRVQVLE